MEAQVIEIWFSKQHSQLRARVWRQVTARSGVGRLSASAMVPVTDGAALTLSPGALRLAGYGHALMAPGCKDASLTALHLH
jgi:hypothetical protein